ncbi:MAG: ribosome silencing factor [bacterium]
MTKLTTKCPAAPKSTIKSSSKATAKLGPKAIAKECCDLALEKKAENVTLIDLRSLNAPTDYFVIASGTSERQVRAIADHVVEEMAKRGVRAWHVEGLSARKWILIDYVNIVVHVFNSETRRFYSLETLWGDAPSEDVKPKTRRTSKE